MPSAGRWNASALKPAARRVVEIDVLAYELRVFESEELVTGRQPRVLQGLNGLRVWRRSQKRPQRET